MESATNKKIVQLSTKIKNIGQAVLAVCKNLVTTSNQENNSPCRLRLGGLFLLLFLGNIGFATITITSNTGTCGNTCDGEIIMAIGGDAGPFSIKVFSEDDDEDPVFFMENINALPPNPPISITIPDLCVGIYSIEVENAYSCTVPFTPQILDLGAQNIVIETGYESCICAPGGFGVIEPIVTSLNPVQTYTWTGDNNYASSSTTTPNVYDVSESGVYTLTVTDMEGCQNSATYFMGLCSYPFFDYVTYPSCDGPGTGAIYASIGEVVQPPFSYIWTYENEPFGGYQSDPAGLTFATNLDAGEYCLYIFTGNGCASSQCWTIEEIATPMVVDYVVNPVSESGANNGSIELIVPNGSEYSYLWSNGEISQNVNQLSEGTYTVTVSNRLYLQNRFRFITH